jgi:hypothetical protein
VLCAVSAGYAQTTSLDREVKVASGREVRVGIYTSMRADCTAGPLPAIRLSVAPEHPAGSRYHFDWGERRSADLELSD